MQLLGAAKQATGFYDSSELKQIFDCPIFILSAPRSGSTLLFEQMAKLDGYWSMGAESHAVFAQFPHLRFENANLDSGCLHASHADAQTREGFLRCFLFLAVNKLGQRYITQEKRIEKLHFVEKTPRNALNIGFLKAIFPHAKFIYLYRDPRQNIASMIEAWQLGQQTGQFVTYPQLPGFDKKWCFLLPPMWRSMVGRSLAEIASFQWTQTNAMVMEQLCGLSQEQWIKVSYQDLITQPEQELDRLNEFVGANSQQLSHLDMALSKTTVSVPHPDKWKKFEKEIMALESQWAPIFERLESS